MCTIGREKFCALDFLCVLMCASVYEREFEFVFLCFLYVCLCAYIRLCVLVCVSCPGHVPVRSVLSVQMAVKGGDEEVKMGRWLVLDQLLMFREHVNNSV